MMQAPCTCAMANREAHLLFMPIRKHYKIRRPSWFMTLLRFALLALVLAVPLAFADIAPPPMPQMVVHMTDNGQPDPSVTEVAYSCTIPNSMNETAGSGFMCSGGTCTEGNGDIYDRCTAAIPVHFVYEYAGRQMATANLTFDPAYTLYNVTIDAPSGIVTNSTGIDTKNPYVPSSCCLSGLMLPAILLAAFLGRR